MLSPPFPWPPARRVSDVENHQLVALNCVKDRVFESANVFSSNAWLFRLLSRIGVFQKLAHGLVDAIRKICDQGRNVFE